MSNLTDSGTFYLIEFAGLPGAGKTTVFEAVCKEVEEVPNCVLGHLALKRKVQGGWARLGLVSELLASLNAILSLPRLHAALWRYGVNCRGASIHLLRQVLEMGVGVHRVDILKRSRGARGRTVALLDQGLVQGLGSLSIPGISRPIIGLRELAEVSCRGRLDGVVWIDCDVDLALSRIGQRTHGRSRFDGHCSAALGRSELVRMDWALHSAVNQCRNMGVPVVCLQAAVSPEENARKVKHFLSSTIA